MNDPFDLKRFVDAQTPVYAGVISELRAGRKRSHWMWFIFPQLAGLGFSAMAQRYALTGLAEAQAYLDHGILGPRLRDCTGAVLAVPDRTITEILGRPDDLKFCSCMTLFEQAAPDDIFTAAIDRFCSGWRDERTLGRLARPQD